jgi:acetyl esterase/lipase
MKTRHAMAAVTLSIVGIAACMAAEKPVVLDVWPDKVPGETADIGPEKLVDAQPGQRQVVRLTNVSRPTISVFRPDPKSDTGAAVLIAPGGGYNILAWDLEGEEVAAWLNSIGVTGIVLKYRVPRRPGQPQDAPPIGPLQDAQRAVSVVRGKAAEWKIDPRRIGMLGFSAGGHLTAATSTNFDKRAYDRIDATDDISCRPDFSVLIYTGGIQEKGKMELAPTVRVSSETPPAFLVHAGDDRISSEHSVLYYLALKRANVPAELHIYATGGHGFGLRPSDDPCSTWPQRCAEWLKRQGLLKPQAAGE